MSDAKLEGAVCVPDPVLPPELVEQIADLGKILTAEMADGLVFGIPDYASLINGNRTT